MSVDKTNQTDQSISNDLPWYADGLRFECTQCGNCCTGQPGYVWVDDSELQEIADLLEVSIGEVRLLHTRQARGRISLTEYANGDCTFFDPEKSRCRVYSARPRQCRTWPFWRSNLQTSKTWREMESHCPGAGCGKLVTLDEIEKLAAETNV
ncbi:MAG: YkgJ family cysteine cluster protein [Planctomycetaceae bacterium]|nr:YkgJ family cysteine cluster protein [Planctomycetaceae bacterium]